MSIRTSPESIAAAIVQIAFREDVDSELLPCGLGILPVASEGISGWDCYQHLSTFLVWCSLRESSLGITPDVSRILVHPHRNINVLEQISPQESMVAHTVAQILSSGPNDEIEHTFTRVKELRNLRDIESFLKFAPDVWSKSIAICNPQLVLPLERMRWRCE